MVSILVVVGLLIAVLLLQTFYLFKTAQELDRCKKILTTEEPVKARLDQILENQAGVLSAMREALEKEYAARISKLEDNLRDAKGGRGDSKISDAMLAKGSLKRAVKEASTRSEGRTEIAKGSLKRAVKARLSLK